VWAAADGDRRGGLVFAAFTAGGNNESRRTATFRKDIAIVTVGREDAVFGVSVVYERVNGIHGYRS
jgi:hypothetical protein